MGDDWTGIEMKQSPPWWRDEFTPVCTLDECEDGFQYSDDGCIVAEAVMEMGQLVSQGPEDKEWPQWLTIVFVSVGGIIFISASLAVWSTFHCAHKDRVYRRNSSRALSLKDEVELPDIPHDLLELQKSIRSMPIDP